MNNVTREFLDRIFSKSKTNWWQDLAAETPKVKYGPSARFLETTLQEELSDIPDYRRSDRSMYFFSKSSNSSIDGRYRSLGVEEKFNTIDLKEHLIDGAIHRGVVWAIGKPQATQETPEAVSLYVVKSGSVPMDQTTIDLFVPVLIEVAKVGVYVFFVNEETGENWYANPKKRANLPSWLSTFSKPYKWDLELDQLGDHNDKAFSLLNDRQTLEKLPSRQLYIPNMGKKGEFTEYSDGTFRVAVMDYGNQWRLIELGLFLRALGYDAVKVIYNKAKHKNGKDKTKDLVSAGRGVEKRIADEFALRYAILIDWKTFL